MNRQTWCTKEDVLKDLAVATGKELHIDNSYLVVGERPPPQLLCESDDEMELMFRDAVGERPVGVESAPDLRGITQMLRMVQSYDDASTDCNTKICSTRPKSPCDVISISKLNPNVKEFLPRGTGAHVANKPKGLTYPVKNEVNIELDPKLAEDCDDQNRHRQKQEAVDKHIELKTNDAPINGLNRNKIDEHVSKDETAELRNKTQEPKNNAVSKFQVKKERNVAMSNLEKLLSKQSDDNPTDVVKQTAKPIKLLTPDYYKHSKAEEVETDIVIQHENRIADDTLSSDSCCRSSKPSRSSYEVIKLLHSKLNGGTGTSSDPGIPNDVDFPKLETETLSTESRNKTDDSGSSDKLLSDTNLSDPQVRDSIKKVNRWMNRNDGKSKENHPSPQLSSPSPPVLLNAITFKRKEVRKSPTVSETKISKSSQHSFDHYKPSEYAQELSKMYMDRVNKIKTVKEKNSWANLDELLKEKDEKIKQERLKAQGEMSSKS